MTSTLFYNGTVRRLPGKAVAEWLLIEDDLVTAIGKGDAPRAERSIDLDGTTLVPAFRDAHVHLPATGLAEAGMDVHGIGEVDRILSGLRERAETHGLLYAANFEEPLDRPLTRHELDAAVGGKTALVARADLHSCVVSSAILDQLDLEGLEGVDRDDDGVPTGFLREQAAAQAWSWFDRNLPKTQQKQAILAGVRRAYSRGIAQTDEMFVVEWRGWESAEVFAAAIDGVALEIPLWLGTTDVDRVKELGHKRIGGDLFLDGSFGSHTAWMSEPYASPPPASTPPTGISYRDEDELHEFFRRAQEAGMQTGVHAIGDAAIEQALTTWEKVAADVGVDAVRALGHRIEHFECATDDHIERCLALGVRASVQPAFDRYWGGPDGLYAERLGWDRAAGMNRFSSMLDAGMILAAGSDSTVTPMDPFLQMAALREHHVESERCSPLEALRMHTIGPARISDRHTERSTLEPGMKADIAWLDRDPLSCDVAELLATEVIGTWIAGRQVWPPADAESP